MNKHSLKTARINGPRTVELDCRDLSDSVTLFIGEGMGDAIITPYAVAGAVVSPIADGGPIIGEGENATTDIFGNPVRRVIYGGNMDFLRLVITGATHSDFEVTIR